MDPDQFTYAAAALELDPQWAFNGLLVLLGALAGWILKNIKASIDQLWAQDQALTDKVQQIEILVAGNYITKAEMEKYNGQVMSCLRRIEDKLDGKVDK